LGHLSDFLISTPELRYGVKKPLGVNSTNPHISAQGWKSNNRPDGPKSSDYMSLHAKYQINTTSGLGHAARME